MTLSIPHGGSLINRYAEGNERERLLAESLRWPSILLTAEEVSDLELLANGAYSPLTGFLGEADYRSVLERLRLADGLPWSLPVTLAVNRVQARELEPGQTVALRDPAGNLLAALELREIYAYDKAAEARAVYGTEDPAHPGVARLQARGSVLLAGPVTALHPIRSSEFQDRVLSPAEARAAFAARGWRTVVGFQTRNPIHRAHEHIQKVALEGVDGLFIHPLVGATKGDDVPAEVRLKCYDALLEHYYPSDRVLLAVFPAAMRYAGPREAVFHALVRKNYGCTHFIVGRDHAGVGSYYGTYAAQELVASFGSELGITALPFDNSFFCRRCTAMASAKTCPHDAEHHVALSGTKVRALLRAGELPPPEFSRPEVARILVESYAGAPA